MAGVCGFLVEPAGLVGSPQPARERRDLLRRPDPVQPEPEAADLRGFAPERNRTSCLFGDLPTGGGDILNVVSNFNGFNVETFDGGTMSSNTAVSNSEHSFKVFGFPGSNSEDRCVGAGEDGRGRQMTSDSGKTVAETQRALR